MYQLTRDSNGAIKKFDAPRDIAPMPAAILERTTTKAAWKVADLSASTSS